MSSSTRMPWALDRAKLKQTHKIADHGWPGQYSDRGQAEGYLSRIQLQQHLSFLHRVTWVHPYRLDQRRAGRLELVFHLHRLEYDQGRSRIHRLASLNLNADYQPRHRGLQGSHQPALITSGGKAPNVTSALVEHLHLPALAIGRESPAPPADRLDREGQRSTINKELPEGCARYRIEGGIVTLSIDGDPVALDLDLDRLPIQQHHVLHAGSSTATLST